MRCPDCQTENRGGRRFCTECGGALALRCATCGVASEPGEKFCGGCGAPLARAFPDVSPATLPASATSQLGVPSSYSPKHLAEKILTSRAALEGERKQVTVLFADLKGSRAPPHGHLATAITMFSDMGMRYWLGQARSETAHVGA